MGLIKLIHKNESDRQGSKLYSLQMIWFMSILSGVPLKILVDSSLLLLLLLLVSPTPLLHTEFTVGRVNINQVHTMLGHTCNKQTFQVSSLSTCLSRSRDPLPPLHSFPLSVSLHRALGFYIHHVFWTCGCLPSTEHSVE